MDLKGLGFRNFPKGPSSPYLRTLGPLWVPKTINKDYYLGPSG